MYLHANRHPAARIRGTVTVEASEQQEVPPLTEADLMCTTEFTAATVTGIGEEMEPMVMANGGDSTDDSTLCRCLPLLATSRGGPGARDLCATRSSAPAARRGSVREACRWGFRRSRCQKPACFIGDTRCAAFRAYRQRKSLTQYCSTCWFVQDGAFCRGYPPLPACALLALD
jgi:hypothetical protein